MLLGVMRFWKGKGRRSGGKGIWRERVWIARYYTHRAFLIVVRTYVLA